MAKAIIAKVERLENGYLVTYESGMTRSYATLPKTVKEWMAARPDPEEEPEEIAPKMEEEQAPEPVTEMEPEAANQEEPPITGEAPEPVTETKTEEPPKMATREPEPAPMVEPRPLQDTAVTVLPPKGEMIVLTSETSPAAASIVDRLLSIWDGFTATIETAWEMYLYPVIMVLLSVLGAAWAATKAAALILWTGARMAYRGARAALPVVRVVFIQAWGSVVVMALMGARMAVYAARAGIVAASFAADLAARAAGEIRDGWQMREDLINEWREAA